MRTTTIFRLLSLTAVLFGPAGARAEPLKVLIAYDTRTGSTESLAGAVAEGVRSVAGVEALIKKTNEVLDEEIAGAEGVLVGSPVHWGSLSAETKSFLDRIGDVLVRENELGPGSTPELRVGGAFVTGGAVSSGKELARIAILAALLNMKFVVVGGEEADGFGTLGAQATTGESDPGISESELSEARRFGERFATMMLRIYRPAP